MTRMPEDMTGIHHVQTGAKSNSSGVVFRAIYAIQTFIRPIKGLHVYLALYIRYTVCGEGIFIQGNFCLLEIPQEPKFALK